MKLLSDPIILANMIMAFAAIASFIASFFLFYRSQRQQRDLEGRLASNNAHLSAFRLLAEVPEAIRFLGISNEDMDSLRKAGIEREELAFLFIHFRAGLYYDEVAGLEDTSPYQPGHFRFTTLSVPETREAWKVIRKTLPNSTFKRKMNATIQTIEHDK